MATQNPEQMKSPSATRKALQQDDPSARMTQAGEQSHQKGHGAPDSQYGTDSSSKTGDLGGELNSTSAPSSAGATESSTGADRDTMDGARSKGAKGGASTEKS